MAWPWLTARFHSGLLALIVVASHLSCWHSLEVSPAGPCEAYGTPHEESDFVLATEDEVTMIQLSLGSIRRQSRQALHTSRGPLHAGGSPALTQSPTQPENRTHGAQRLPTPTKRLSPKQLQSSNQQKLGPLEGNALSRRFHTAYRELVDAYTGAPESPAGKSFALIVLAMVVLPLILFAMTQTRQPLVAGHTWFVIDNSSAAFLAALWAHVAKCVINEIHTLEVQLLVAILHAVLLLAGSVTLAWFLRADREHLITCCSCAVYIVSFAFAYAAKISQIAFFSSCYSLCVVGIASLVFVQLLLAVLLYQTKRLLGLRHGGSYPDCGPKSWAERIPLYQARRMNGFENRFESPDADAVEWVELVEVIENDYAAIALGAVVSKCFCFVIVGTYPGVGNYSHTVERRNHFLAVGGILVVVSAVCLLYGSIFYGPQSQYVTRRTGNFFTSLVVMSAAWTLFDWAHMEEAHDHAFFAFPILAYLGITALSLTVTLLAIFIISWWSSVSDGKFGRWVALQASSLMLGLSAAQGAAAAVEVLLQPLGYQIILLLALDLLVFWVYVMYLKPITFEKEMMY